eukprot:2227077-Amphidinium_carterae.1
MQQICVSEYDYKTAERQPNCLPEDKLTSQNTPSRIFGRWFRSTPACSSYTANPKGILQKIAGS